MAIATIRGEGIKRVGKLIDLNTKNRSKLFKTVLLECGLACVRNKNLKNAAYFMGNVAGYGELDSFNERSIVYLSEVQSAYFTRITNIDAICRLVSELADI